MQGLICQLSRCIHPIPQARRGPQIYRACINLAQTTSFSKLYPETGDIWEQIEASFTSPTRTKPCILTSTSWRVGFFFSIQLLHFDHIRIEEVHWKPKHIYATLVVRTVRSWQSFTFWIQEREKAGNRSRTARNKNYFKRLMNHVQEKKSNLSHSKDSMGCRGRHFGIRDRSSPE